MKYKYKNYYTWFINKPIWGLRRFNEIKKGLDILHLPKMRIFSYLLELYLDKQFFSYILKAIEKAKREFPNPRLGGWTLSYPAGLIYALIRHLKPNVVIETGVGPGGSSSLILNALNKNRSGVLISIDLPDGDLQVYPTIGIEHYNIHIPPGYATGWLVPPWLKDRWDLRIGDSKILLPQILKELKSVDIFYHDSLHTYDHVMFELSTVFPYLKNGGWLLADDVNEEYWTLAFVEFCKKMNLPFFVFGKKIGFARKD